MDKGHLEQAGDEDRDVDRLGDLTLEKGHESTSPCYRPYTFPFKLLGRVDEERQERGVPLIDEFFA